MNNPEFNLQFQKIDRLVGDLKHSREYLELAAEQDERTEARDRAGGKGEGEVDGAGVAGESMAGDGLTGEKQNGASNQWHPGKLARELGITAKEEMASFLFFWNLINYHTSEGERSFGERGKGANPPTTVGIDLLFTLVKQERSNNPGLFTASQMLNAANEKLVAMMTLPNGRGPSDVQGRINLLREGALYLQNSQGGSALRLLEHYAGLTEEEKAGGLVAFLAKVPGYQDRQGHKANLLIKQLEQAGILDTSVLGGREEETKGVAPDKTMMTLAVRLGLAEGWSRVTQERLNQHEYVGVDDLVGLRAVTAKAWREVARKLGVGIYWLDEVMWKAGQEILAKEESRAMGDAKAQAGETDGSSQEGGSEKEGAGTAERKEGTEAASTDGEPDRKVKTVREVILAQKDYDPAELVVLPFTRFL